MQALPNDSSPDALAGRLRDAGYRPTVQRRSVFEAIAGLRHPDIAEIHESCSGVGVVSVYRTVALLCEPCGEVFDFPERPASELGAFLDRVVDLDAEIDRVEVYGRCRGGCPHGRQSKRKVRSVS